MEILRTPSSILNRSVNLDRAVVRRLEALGPQIDEAIARGAVRGTALLALQISPLILYGNLRAAISDLSEGNPAEAAWLAGEAVLFSAIYLPMSVGLAGNSALTKNRFK